MLLRYDIHRDHQSFLIAFAANKEILGNVLRDSFLSLCGENLKQPLLPL